MDLGFGQRSNICNMHMDPLITHEIKPVRIVVVYAERVSHPERRYPGLELRQLRMAVVPIDLFD
jgi:hypothetical protein